MVSQLNTPGSAQTVSRPQFIRALARVRLEWQEAAGENSLIEMDGNVGLLLADIARSLGLTPLEQLEALGRETVEEIQAF